MLRTEDRPPATSREFDNLYRTQWRSMVRLAVLLTDDRAVAEDVVQDAFVSLHRRWDGLREQANATAYLRAAVVNGARSVIRRRIVARRHIQLVVPDLPGADDPLLVAEEHRETLAAVRTLPRRQHEVLVLRYWANLSEAEIAATLGISTGTVKSSASRGLAALERILGASR